MLLFAGFSEQWSLGHKVDFDGENRRIRIAPGVTELSVKNDIYSSWKEWVQLYTNSKYVPAMRSIGGDPADDGLYAGDMYFLINGWQIEVDHLVKINGILYHDDPIDRFVINPGGGVEITVSNLAYSREIPSTGLLPEEVEKLNAILELLKKHIILSY